MIMQDFVEKLDGAEGGSCGEPHGVGMNELDCRRHICPNKTGKKFECCFRVEKEGGKKLGK